MGRPPKRPEDWLDDSDQMLSWLEDQLRKKSALPYKPMTETREEYLLRALKNHLEREGTDPREFTRLKRAWRGYKSGKKRKYATTTLRMPLSTHEKLKRIAGDSSLSEVMNELIEGVDEVRKKVRQDLEDQYQRRIQRKFPSPPQQVRNELRRTRAQLKDQKLANQHLYQEIAQYLVLLEDAGVAKTRLTAEQRARVEEKYQAMASLPEERLSEFLYSSEQRPPDGPDSLETRSENAESESEQDQPLTPESFEKNLREDGIPSTRPGDDSGDPPNGDD